MTATFRSQPELDATWQAVQAQAAEARDTGADINAIIERDAEAHNARALAIRAAKQRRETISNGTRRAAQFEKSDAVQRLYNMARAVALIVGVPEWQRVADWIDGPPDHRADLTEPRTARELAAQWREQEME